MLVIDKLFSYRVADQRFSTKKRRPIKRRYFFLLAEAKSIRVIVSDALYSARGIKRAYEGASFEVLSITLGNALILQKPVFTSPPLFKVGKYLQSSLEAFVEITQLENSGCVMVI